ncbi:MAG TPA: TIGR01212 family radical SAM protein [Caldithrix abyssi]|uniref:TIGR01212 family radical SAM protein n=1 Tax=Caldithrix abyssi TaxID=187145 RepID=A0A7V4WWU8_CALAY|nr:TIGR01212 family radical SAM protein [Caldithrix abyssi]
MKNTEQILSRQQIFPWGTAKRYNAFADYQKKIYGERVQKVTVDAGFTCPNRDGTVAKGGCIYCNNESFNPSYNSAEKSISQQIEEGVEFLKRRYGKINKFIVYFQPYSNTYAPLETLKRYYEEALSHPEVIGLTIGTRPDCVDDKILRYLEELAASYDITIEYGLESISDETLKKINRGHDVQSYLDALEMTAHRGIKICTHMIFGFPWEQPQQWIDTAGWLSELPFDFLKVHQLHIVSHTVLADMYRKNPFSLISYPEYIKVITAFLERLSPHIVIQRLFGEAPPRTLIAPHWGIRNSQLLKLLDDALELNDTWQGKKYGK